MGPTVVSRLLLCVCFNVNDKCLCTCMCVYEWKKNHKITFPILVSCWVYKWAPGPPDQPLHQLAARLEGPLLLSFSPTSSPSFALCPISALWLLFFRSSAASPPALGASLMKSASFVIPPSSQEMMAVQRGQRSTGDNSPLN